MSSPASPTSGLSAFSQMLWVPFRLDANGSLIEAGPSVEKLTGQPAAYWEGRPDLLLELVAEPSRAAYLEHATRTLATPAGSFISFPTRRMPQLKTLALQEYRKATLSPAGKLQGIEGLWIDASHPQALETRLGTAFWKETIGALVPGLIHEFNNTLTGILSLSDLFLGQIQPGHPFHDGLGLIKQNAQQASQRLQRLHSLYRSSPGPKSYQDLNELARDTVDLLQRAVRRAELSLLIAADTLPVYADPVQLQQAMMQLIFNALEAMPEGGQVKVETHRWETVPEQLRGETVRVPTVSLTVEDAGSGLTPAELKTVFHPLFTTKKHRAMGLGLHYARICAGAHQGALTLQSRPGFGTTATLWLPQADFSEAETSPEEAVRQKPTA